MRILLLVVVGAGLWLNALLLAPDDITPAPCPDDGSFIEGYSAGLAEADSTYWRWLP